MGAWRLGGRWAERVKALGRKAFSPAYLLGTNVGLSCFLSGLGDCLQQRNSQKPSINVKQPYDCGRTVRMSVAGSSMGFLCHYWYRWLDGFLPGKGIKTVARKVVWDQIVLSPVMWVAFFVVLGVLESGILNRERLKERLYHVGGQIYVTEWIVWPPAQAINFYFLPTRFRVLYDNVISLGFDIYTSYLIHDNKCFPASQ